jgi:maleate isomerase
MSLRDTIAAADPDRTTRIGILTPSSNTVLEPLTSAMVADLGDVTAHFGRFRVTEISTRPDSDAQFDLSAQLAAAELLADAKVDAIVWSGTSASWLGFGRDRAMCDAILDRTGIPAHSAVLATNAIFDALDVRRFGLVSPYVAEIEAKIVANYAAAERTCTGSERLDVTENFAFALATEAEIEGMIRRVAETGPDAISIMCTNMRGAAIAPRLESELGIPIIDSTAAAVWGGLVAAGADPARVEGWGGLFTLR